jgi:hypothetical protein
MKYSLHYRDEQEPLPVTIMAEDEVHFYQGTTITRKWSLKGQQPTLYTPPGRNKIGYFGAVDLLTGKLITMPEEEHFTQYTFQEFLEWVLRFTQGKIIFLLDNAKWHHAKRIQQFVEKHKDRLELLFLPPYSPQLNPIERVWRITRLKFTHNRYFMSIYDLMSVLTMQFFRWSEPNEELKTLCATI